MLKVVASREIVVPILEKTLIRGGQLMCGLRVFKLCSIPEPKKSQFFWLCFCACFYDVHTLRNGYVLLCVEMVLTHACTMGR